MVNGCKYSAVLRQGNRLAAITYPSPHTMKHTPQSLAKQFCQGSYVNIPDKALWQHTFQYLAETVDEHAFQKRKIQALWNTYGGDVRARIKNDALVLQVLKKSLPGYDGQGITLYRGESWFLFDQNQLGFCWTSNEDLATAYAKGLNAVESGGVLLKCHAPPHAILAAPDTPDLASQHYICDSSQLLRVTTLGLFPKL